MAVYNEKEFKVIDVNDTYDWYIIKYEFNEGLAIISDMLYHELKKKITVKYQNVDQTHIEINVKIKKDNVGIDKWDNSIWVPLWSDKFDGLFRIDYFNAEAEYTITIPRSVYLIFECQDNKGDYHFFENENVADHMTIIDNDINEGKKYTINFPAYFGWQKYDITKKLIHFPEIHHTGNTIIMITNYNKDIRTNVVLTKLKSNKVSIYRKSGTSTKDQCIVGIYIKYILIDLKECSDYNINVPQNSNVYIYLANGSIQYVNSSDGSLSATAKKINNCGYSGCSAPGYQSWSYDYGHSCKIIDNGTSINQYIKSKTDSKFKTNDGKIYVPGA